MADAAQEIEAIVREVLRRLAAGETAPPADVAAESPPTSKADEPSNGRLTISHRVVSLSDIHDRLQSVRQVVLRRGAVVTPSVRDELRRRRIAVTYECSPSPDASQCELLVGAVATDRSPDQWLTALEIEPGRFRRITAATLPEALQSMLPPVSSGKTLGLLLTSQTAAALCLANRNPGVRAALGHDAASVTQAVQTIGANLLIVHPDRQSAPELKRIVREFLRLGRRACPPEFQRLLESG